MTAAAQMSHRTRRGLKYHLTTDSFFFFFSVPITEKLRGKKDPDVRMPKILYFYVIKKKGRILLLVVAWRAHRKFQRPDYSHAHILK